MLKKTTEKMKKFWTKNLEENAIKLSIGIGAFFVSLVMSLALVLVGGIQTGVIDWTIFLIDLVISGKFLGILFCYSFFGKKENGGLSGEETSKKETI